VLDKVIASVKVIHIIDHQQISPRIKDGFVSDVSIYIAAEHCHNADNANSIKPTNIGCLDSFLYSINLSLHNITPDNNQDKFSYI
jgi:hypothetical protein